MLHSLKHNLIGRPLHTAEAIHQRLSNSTALAVFSSDALSSTAYATEEILLVLIAAGAAALSFSLPIAGAVALLLLIVTASYRQTIAAYPGGGGAYVVSRHNLGELPGLAAGASLLIDYVLTAAVSISAGLAALGAAFPALLTHRVAVGLFLVLLITVANLRGVKESGFLFAIPTYAFVLSVAVVVGVGLFKWATGGLSPLPTPAAQQATTSLSLFLILRAFSSGCAALTGVEAISNGVPAFREPAAANARKTLTWMAAILGVFFVGITFLAVQLRLSPVEDQTVLAQLTGGVLGRGALFYFVQLATATVLTVAANTSYADFPRLASLLARDGFLPKQFANRGDRLVFSNGIIALGLFSGALIVAFGGDTHRLIALYAVGVFTSFTLSQLGMVRLWLTKKGERYHHNAVINGIGAAATAIVLVVVATTKFLAGAWMVFIVGAVLIAFFKSIQGHYRSIATQLSLEGIEHILPTEVKNNVLVLVSGMHRGTLKALEYSRALSPHYLQAVIVDIDPQATAAVQQKWPKWGQGVDLHVIESPYRGILQPLKEYITAVDLERPDDVITLIIPEFIPSRWWEHLLHNQTALLIKLAFVFQPNVVIVDIPYQLT